MSKEIKCPICQGVSTLRYNENRTYMSHCHDVNCLEFVTVTASNEAAAEELFSKFEKGTSQPKLNIPNKIAEIADKYGFYQIDKDEALELTVAIDCPEERIEAELIYDYADKNTALLTAYLACKVLGVELMEVEE